ncbi:MAG: tetratricopeptide repeat protein [Chlorobi bacterium]|nr:tetratricopeptide repeat protein [Chlorobiota bacterium]
MKKVYSILTRVLVASLVVVLPLSTVAQGETTTKEKKAKKDVVSFAPYWFIQGEVGPSFSHTDVSRYNFAPDFQHMSINGELGFGRQWTKVWNTYISLERGFFNGEVRNIYPKNIKNGPYDLKFTNDYYGGNINVGVNLSNWWGGYKDRLVTFGIHAGVGNVMWKEQTRTLNTDKFFTSYGYKNDPDNRKGGGINGRKIALTVPVGVMVNFNVSDKVDIYGDYVYSWMDTDVADGIVHGAMQVYNDVYSHFNVGVRLKFGADKIKKMSEGFDEVQLNVTPDPLAEKGDSVEVTIKGTFPPKYFDKNAVVCFTPVLKWDGGEIPFETMNFKGEAVEGDGVMISHDNGGSFTYTSKVPYDPAMDVSELYVAPVFYKYNGTVYETCAQATEAGKYYTAVSRKLVDGVVHTAKYIRHNEQVNFAPDFYEKETIVTKEANIFFRVNMANLNLRLPLNKDNKNVTARDSVMNDMAKGWAVKDITINGWASPEGEETFNQNLSQKRAHTAAKYMEKKIKKAAKKNDNIPNDIWDNLVVNEIANGPDWNGFMKAVEGSDIQDKSAIINVINAAGTASKKEEEIRNMILIYPELERSILPPLRRAIIDVNTYEPKRTDEEIANLATSDPSKLSLEEMFYAATLTNDNGTKRVIYSNIMNLHPKCFRGYVNAAAVELEDGNLQEAKDLLDQAKERKDDAYQLWNNYGVYYALSGDYAKAKESFAKAKDLGADVNYNMGLVNIYYGNYAEAVSNLSSYECDFNLGLAQLLNGDYHGAEKTFQCVDPKDAETNYLLAITAARMDNKEKALDYLGKAFKMNPDSVSKAKYDREFIKYANDPGFKALVGLSE